MPQPYGNPRRDVAEAHQEIASRYPKVLAALHKSEIIDDLDVIAKRYEAHALALERYAKAKNIDIDAAAIRNCRADASVLRNAVTQLRA